MADLDDVKSRIRALLARTRENGCTEAEAIAAADKAMQLLRQHGLDEETLDITRAHVASRGSRRQPLDDLWGAVAMVCRCRVALRQMPGEPLRWTYTGRLAWPEIAVWLQGTLTAAHGRALDAYRASPEYRRRRTPRTRALARRQWTAGFAAGVRDRLHRLATPDVEAITRELALIDRATAAERAGMGKIKPLGAGSAGRDSARDRAAGIAAGTQTNVNWALRGAAPKLLGRS